LEFLLIHFPWVCLFYLFSSSSVRSHIKTTNKYVIISSDDRDSVEGQNR
jgi:hypothetical protein